MFCGLEKKTDELGKAWMNHFKHIRIYLLVYTLVVIGQPLQGLAQQNSEASKAD